jgi:hypothetical protein
MLRWSVSKLTHKSDRENRAPRGRTGILCFCMQQEISFFVTNIGLLVDKVWQV